VTVRRPQIGIDFDNTLVDYDALFHTVAVENGLISGTVPRTKVAVREYLKQAGLEDRWTELQGDVYGGRMAEAVAYPGALEFLEWARHLGISLTIVSHKTRYPYLGERRDLHEAARGWIATVLNAGPAPLVPETQVYFELTTDAKLGRIAHLGLDCFIDDLPEILLAEGFPERTSRCLFDPDSTRTHDERLAVFRSWNDIQQHVERQWQTTR
jgi:hypothetical protein